MTVYRQCWRVGLSHIPSSVSDAEVDEVAGPTRAQRKHLKLKKLKQTVATLRAPRLWEPHDDIEPAQPVAQEPSHVPAELRGSNPSANKFDAREREECDTSIRTRKRVIGPAIPSAEYAADLGVASWPNAAHLNARMSGEAGSEKGGAKSDREAAASEAGMPAAGQRHFSVGDSAVGEAGGGDGGVGESSEGGKEKKVKRRRDAKRKAMDGEIR